MLSRDLGHFRVLTDRIEGISNEFAQRYQAGELSLEEEITDRILERIAMALNYRDREFSIEAKAITIKKSTEEPEIGADAMILLSYVSPQVRMSKGVLVQAKRVDHNGSLKTDEMKRLKVQCAKMLSVTPESYVWAYSKDRFRSFRGFSVSALETRRLEDLCYNYIPAFFSFFLRCQIGDPNLSLDDYARLQSIIRDSRARTVLLASAVSVDPGPEGVREGDPNPNPPNLDQLILRLQDGPEFEPIENHAYWEDQSVQHRQSEQKKLQINIQE